MFEDLNKSIKENQERWEKIEELSRTIKKMRSSSMPQVERLNDIILLMVEHLRPMNPSQEQLDEATKGLDELLKSLKK